MSRGRNVVPFGDARPKPPTELNTEQAKEWREIVVAMPANYFTPGTFPLLTAYCKHICRARQISRMIAREENPNAKLLVAEVCQTNILLTLSTKMRFAHQSNYDRSKRRHVIS